MKRRLFKTLVAVLAIAAAAAGPVRGQNANVSWVLTPYGNLQNGDTVVIVDKTYERAMTNNNGSFSAPSAVEIGLSGDQNALSDAPAATLQWVVERDNGNYMFKVPGTSNYLYCTTDNDGVRVGSGNKSFEFRDGGTYNVPFLKNNATSRYLGLTNAYLWRCPSSISGSSIKDNVISFYKKTVVIIPTYTVRLAAGTEEAANWSIASGGEPVPGTQVLENVMSGSRVTATYNGTTKKVKSVKAVKYVAPVLVQSIVLDKQTASLAKDSTMTLSVASVLPENAADKSYTWSSDNTSVATVNATTGVVTGMAAGTANIIATANDGSGAKDTCVVTVLRSAILDGVPVLYASDYGLETWSTVIGYNLGVMYQDGDYVKLTSNGAILCHDGHPVYADDYSYPPFNDYQWLRVANIDGIDFYYHQGETWQQAIDANRTDNFSWSIEGGQVKNMMQTLVDSNYNPVDPAATIDPSTVNYHLWTLDN